MWKMVRGVSFNVRKMGSYGGKLIHGSKRVGVSLPIKDFTVFLLVPGGEGNKINFFKL